MSMSADYAVLQSAAVLFDRSDRMRMRILGAKAAELITGLVTNDVLSLAPGEGQYAAALTPKGKILADLNIFAMEDGLLLDTSAKAAPGLREMVRKFVNPRIAAYRDITETSADLTLTGNGARLIAGRMSGVPGETLGALPPFAHLRFRNDDVLASAPDDDDRFAMVARMPDLDTESYSLIFPASLREEFTRSLLRFGAVHGSSALWQTLRIEAGRPEWGVDMNDSTLPQEANFDELGAISYTKGCYVGQETVARIHFRGHVNRFLRKVKFLCGAPPPLGAQLIDDDGQPVGELRSTAISPRQGGIGIAMVRREIAIGTSLEAKWEGGSCTVQVTANEKGATI
ncbi:MAG: folate-binding protein YgfZ [Gemmatimonadaceae bacterium]|nr:folate-binding protein YgfZ [Gemmatimonadaceae bacterium]